MSKIINYTYTIIDYTIINQKTTNLFILEYSCSYMLVDTIIIKFILLFTSQS